MQDTERTAGLIGAYGAWRLGLGAGLSRATQDWQEGHFAEFLARGFARRTEEDWRYSNTSHLLALQHQVSDANARLKLALPEGIEQKNLAQALTTDESLRADFDRGIGPRSIFANLNLALLSEGQAIRVPANFKGEAFVAHDLNTTHEWTSQTQHWQVGEGAELTVVETIRGEVAATYNGLRRWQIAPHARVTHIVMSQGTGHLNVVTRDEVTVAEHGRFERYNVSLGQALQRQEVSVQLAGQEARCDVVQMHLVPGQTQAELLLNIDHQAPETKSTQLIKGLVAKGGLSHVTGAVHITENARGSEARQLIRHLLLGEKAEANAKPQLKIDTDDVACSHGATVAQVNALELFYLMSRGITRGDALKLLSDAFAKEVLWRGNDLGPLWHEGFAAAMQRFASREMTL